jgi:hypothetical protein
MGRDPHAPVQRADAAFENPLGIEQTARLACVDRFLVELKAATARLGIAGTGSWAHYAPESSVLPAIAIH